MGSRRTRTRSLSNGRPLNGTEMSGSSRSPGCSYLSNVRPENRSTLCSVMAQLTEETQPLFEITLKSKAVSENCNVKFSCVVTGHPTPQVTWYKDDTQLDRYCGLPKYEIFRNGQNHSLHIYNCTVEDAAIYQASATNTKGIVSCSGVLEVGEMNEFKIHQRYFSKIKQKAENRRREAEGKENQEPLRTISPDRAQRKRRSTVGGYLSAPSSSEDGGSEENQQDVAAEVKARLHETTVEEVKDTNATVSPLTNGQDVKEKSSKTGTHIYDSAQKIFSALQPKTAFFKKIKISNTAKVSPDEKRTSADSTESAESKNDLEDFMEVESIATSNSREVKDRLEKTEKLESINQGAEVTVPAQTETNTSSLVPAFTALRRRVTNIAGKQAAKQEKEGECKTAKENVKVQNRSPSIASLPLHSSASKLQQSQPMIKEDTCITPDTKVMEQNKKPGSSTDMTSRTNVPCDSRAALPQPRCELARDQLPEKETSTAKKKVCVPQPVLSSEATPALTATKRSNAPVALELQSNRHTTEAPETTPAESAAHDSHGPSLHHGLQKAIDKMTQDHSRGSNESCTGLFTDTQKPPLESPSAGANTPECNVSLTAQQSQLNTPIKTVEGTEIQLDEKVKGNEIATLTAQSARVSQNEKSEMVMVSQKEKVGEVARENYEMTVNVPNGDKESKLPIKTVEKICSDGHKMRQPETETAPITKDPEKFSEPELTDFQKGQTPFAKIVSIAELLRSQIKALEQSVPTHLAPSENAEDHTGSKSSKEFRESGSTSVKKSDKDTGTSIERSPPQTIKATLMQIYNELIKTNELIEEEAPSRLQKPLEIPSLVTATCEQTAISNENRINRLTQNKNMSESVSKEDESPPKVRRKEHILTPEIKLNSETVLEVSEIIPTPIGDKGKQQELKTSGLEPELELPVKSALDTDTQVSYPHQDSSRTENIVMTVSLAHLNPETSPLLKKRDCASPIPSATPQELASGARRKILSMKTKLEEEEPSALAKDLNQKPAPLNASTSPRLSRHSTLLEEQTALKEKGSPLLSRKKSPEMMSQQLNQEVNNVKHEEKPSDKSKNDPFKAPQVIRKIRSETFTEMSGHLKLWCQFFNILSESTVIWQRNDVEIAKMKKSAGDETQVKLALAQASVQDSGVYGCTITNEYGTDSTDYLLSAELLTGMSLREDLGVGEEIEMTPLLFNKGVADSSVWGNKFFGRIMVQESRLGEGFSHKTWRAKVIYGLEPVFESGNTCMIKVCNPIAYGGKGEGQLIEKNLEAVKQACKIQNLAREYCKIFSAEARVIENFGPSLEVIPVYLMYRPANIIPYATVEADLMGVYRKYSVLDHTGRLEMRTESEVEQKCCALQHWIYQWTSGNMLLTKLEGVDSKITNIGVSVKSTGHQGLSIEGNPKAFEQFVIQHQCNYFCGLLGLRSLKVIESLLMPTKPKGSKSPLVQRKMGTGSSSPQTGRKASASPRMPRKTEQDGRNTPSKQRAPDESKDKLSNNL